MQNIWAFRRQPSTVVLYINHNHNHNYNNSNNNNNNSNNTNNDDDTSYDNNTNGDSTLLELESSEIHSSINEWNLVTRFFRE